MVRMGRVNCRAIARAIPFQVAQRVSLQVRISTALPQRGKVLAAVVIVRVDHFLHAPLTVAPDANFLFRVREGESLPTRQVKMRVLCARPFRMNAVLVARCINPDGAESDQHGHNQRERPHREVCPGVPRRSDRQARIRPAPESSNPSWPLYRPP